MNARLLLPLFALLLATACNPPSSNEAPKSDASKTDAPAAPQPEAKPKEAEPEVAVIKTTEGELVIEFWSDVAPKTVENFKKLAKDGFYDGTLFHRIIDGFMVQGGDPLTKDPDKELYWGTGGPGYRIQGETNTRADRKHVRGVIAMAHSGHPDTAGSQFYICLAPQPGLDGGYTTFGKLIKGDEVLGKIGKTPVGQGPSGERSRPLTKVGIESIQIVPASSIPQ